MPAKGRARSDGEDATPGERSPPPPDAEPAALAQHEPASGLGHAAGYIGVFATGPDGTRTFKAVP